MNTVMFWWKQVSMEAGNHEGRRWGAATPGTSKRDMRLAKPRMSWHVLTCLEDMICWLTYVWICWYLWFCVSFETYLRMTHDVFFFICLSGFSFVNLSLRKKIWLSMVILASDLHATPWHRPLVAIFPRSYVALAEAKDTLARLRTLDSSGPKKSKRVDERWWRMINDDEGWLFGSWNFTT